jgi:hypothetical protein
VWNDPSATALGRIRPAPHRVVSASCRAGARTAWPSMGERVEVRNLHPTPADRVKQGARIRAAEFHPFLFLCERTRSLMNFPGHGREKSVRCGHSYETAIHGLVVDLAWRRCGQDDGQNTMTLTVRQPTASAILRLSSRMIVRRPARSAGVEFGLRDRSCGCGIHAGFHGRGDVTKPERIFFEVLKALSRGHGSCLTTRADGPQRGGPLRSSGHDAIVGGSKRESVRREQC